MSQPLGIKQGPTTETIEKSIRLFGAPDITWRRKHGMMTGQPYSIRLHFSRLGDAPWVAQVTIYAATPSSVIGDWFSPRSVVDMPTWLAGLIADQAPKGE